MFISFSCGRRTPNEPTSKDKIDGPTIGPLYNIDYEGCHVRIRGQENAALQVESGHIYYKGLWYAAWHISSEPPAAK